MLGGDTKCWYWAPTKCFEFGESTCGGNCSWHSIDGTDFHGWWSCSPGYDWKNLDIDGAVYQCLGIPGWKDVYFKDNQQCYAHYLCDCETNMPPAYGGVPSPCQTKGSNLSTHLGGAFTVDEDGEGCFCDTST